MIEILPGVRQWSWFSEEKHLDFNGLLVESAGERLLVDPPPMTPADREIVRSLGSIGTIVITNRHHLRDAATWREADGSRLIVPEADNDAILPAADGTFGDRDLLAGILRAVRLSGMKTPGETALHYTPPTGERAMILGDALIGKPAGALSLLPSDKIPDAATARASLARLLEFDWDALLLGDGVSLPRGGRKALQDFLAGGSTGPGI